MKNLYDDQKAQFTKEDGTPYPVTRERRNVGCVCHTNANRSVA